MSSDFTAELELDRLGVEMSVAGRAVSPVALGLAPPPPCPHDRFNHQTVVANLVDGAQVMAHRVQVKVRCAECGVPMRMVHPDRSADGLTLGSIIVEVEDDLVDGWEQTPAADA